MQTRSVLALALSLGLAVFAVAQDTSRPAGLQFHNAHEVVCRADAAREGGNDATAIELYQEAMAEYARLSSSFPDWQPGVTRFRIQYCREQLSTLLRRVTRPIPGRPGWSAQPVPRAGAETRVSSRINEAAAMLAHGQTAEAKKTLMTALRADPDNRRVRLFLALARCQESAYQDAVYVLEPLVHEEPDDVYSRMALAAAFAGIGEIDNAIRELNYTLSLRPALAEAHYNMAHLLLALDPPSEKGAAHHYKQSVELGGLPDQAVAERLGITAAGGETEGGRRRLFPFRIFGRGDTPADETAQD